MGHRVKLYLKTKQKGKIFCKKPMAHGRCSMNSSLGYSLITTSKNTAPNAVVSEVLFSPSQASWADRTMARFSRHQLTDTLWVLSESKHVYSHMADPLPSRKARDCGWRTQPDAVNTPRYQSPWATKGLLLHLLGRITLPSPCSIKKERYNPSTLVARDQVNLISDTSDTLYPGKHSHVPSCLLPYGLSGFFQN